MKSPSIIEFQSAILTWYKKNGRKSLPWRKMRDPYRILVSEVMLQQTQVERVKEKYEQFLEHFPTVDALAAAPMRELLSVWQGLGYNRRALYLQRAAQVVEKKYQGVFPRSVALLEELPGIGPYTARAVAVFAFNAPEIIIETNIRRVFIHTFFPEQLKVHDHQLEPMIKKTLYQKNPRQWYNAIMDYGALALKDIHNPNRKSVHYARQSKFEGSRRYARAKLLDLLLHRPKGFSHGTISKYFAGDPFLKGYCEPDVLQSIINDLVSEGFISSVNGLQRII